MAAREDGTLLVQLAQWGSSMNLEEALQSLWSEGFDPETAHAQDRHVSRVLTFGETVGTLTKNGLFDADLARDWVWFAGLWERVGPAARKAREHLGEDQLYVNFEALAQG